MGGTMATAPGSTRHDLVALEFAAAEARRWWWVPLMTGILWLILLVIVFRSRESPYTPAPGASACGCRARSAPPMVSGGVQISYAKRPP